MSFRSIIVFIGFIQAFVINAQNVEWGNPQKVKTKNLYSQIVGENNSGIFVLRCKNNDFSSDVIIEKYKANLSLEISVPAPLSINGNIERVLLVNNNLHIFISARNTISGNIDLLDQKIDAELKPIGSPNVICSFPCKHFFRKRKFKLKQVLIKISC